MKRKIKLEDLNYDNIFPKKADAILCADIHLRDSVPICRTDDFMKAQQKKFLHLLVEAKYNNCPLLIAGDFFHRAKSSPWLEQWVIRIIKKYNVEIIVIPGQHDLPNHNLNEFEKSSMAVLDSAQCFQRCFKVDYNIGNGKYKIKDRTIIMQHTMVYLNNPIHDSIASTSAEKLLKKYEDADVVLTGDNHTPFTFRKDGKILVNPGSMMRTTVDQSKHLPRVYLYYAEDNIVEEHYLPIKKNVVTRKHIEVKEIRDEKIISFISKIKNDYEVGISFRDNLKSFFDKNKVEIKVKKLIWRILEND